jgi:cell division protein FtsL
MNKQGERVNNMDDTTEAELRTERREQRQERHEIRADISGKTTIQLGLIVTLAVILTTVLGFCGSGIWWASKLSEKVDTVLRNQISQTDAMNSTQRDVAELQAWRKVIDVAGTPSASLRLDALGTKLNAVDEMLKLHIAKEEGKKPN